MGYYDPDAPHMAVEFYQGQWILRNRMPDDEIASSSEQLFAIAQWRESNKRKFKAS